MTACTIWTFETRNFAVIVDCDYEQDWLDLSWDETGEVAEKLATGEWNAYTMRARLLTRHGDELACDYLGASIYANPTEFRDHIGSRGQWGSYFTDMVRTVLAEGRAEIKARAECYTDAAKALSH